MGKSKVEREKGQGLNVGNIYPIHIEDLTEDGNGVGRIEGMTVFVHNAFPGDHVMTKLIKVKKQYAIGVIHQMMERSEDHQDAPCPYARQCGGCQLQEYKYEAQVDFKENQIKSALSRIGGLEEVPFEAMLSMAEPSHYRNKGIYQLAPFYKKTSKSEAFKSESDKRLVGSNSRGNNKGKESGKDRRNNRGSGRGKGKGQKAKASGKVIPPVAIGHEMGFYRSRSHEIVSIDTCMLQSELANQIMQVVDACLKESKISIYDENFKTGILRRIMIRTNQGVQVAEKGAMLVFVVTQKDKQVFSLMDEVIKRAPMIRSVFINYNATAGNTALSYDFEHYYGEEYLIDTIGDVRFMISPQSFFQVNNTQTEALYDVVVKYVKEALVQGADKATDERTKGMANGMTKEMPNGITDGVNHHQPIKVLDLYCGIGSIGTYVAKKLGNVGEIIGVEVVESAIEDARKNADFNGIENTSYYVGKAEEVMTDLVKEGLNPDIVILDPPRKGCDETLLETLVTLGIRDIVYVSCKPSTLARDVKFLTENGYDVKAVTGVDMFPWTTHVETIVALYKKD